eukprot:1242952-Pleurochrysis_carterae.AAC.2
MGSHSRVRSEDAAAHLEAHVPVRHLLRGARKGTRARRLVGHAARLDSSAMHRKPAKDEAARMSRDTFAQ